MVRRRLKNLKREISAVLIFALTLALLSNSLFSVALADPDTDNTVTITALQDGGPEIKAGAAVVMDVNTGAVLYQKNGGEARQPSSLTKLMTAYITLSEASLYDTITCSSDAASQNFSTAANIGYKSGESFTVEDALKGMLMASAEDCAYSLAERKSATMSAFAKVMNEYASELGFKNSNFVNSMGKYADGHYSCAYDMALVAAKLMREYPEYKTIVSMSGTTVGATNFSSERTVSSSHRFMVNTDKYAHAYAGKTGGSAYGGNGLWSLCTYASSGSLNLVCIVMDGPTLDSIYQDTKTLFNFVFEEYDSLQVKNVLNSQTTEIGTLFNECEFFDHSSRSVVYVDNQASIALPKHSDSEKITSKLNYTQISEFKYGENKIGEIDFYYDGIFCGEADIIFYTEEASMTATEFATLFPAFLKIPSSINHSVIENTKPKNSSGFLGKIKAGVSSLLTPAKIFSFIIGLLIFAIGALIIVLAFPRKKNFENELYSSRYDELPDSELEGEALTVHRRRNPTQPDMKEF